MCTCMSMSNTYVVHTRELQGRQSGESWPLIDSLSPNSGSEDRTASPKSS